ncbi:hypothetical protein [Allocoleopsis franciscana]|uniref:Uncharacterized protein n=1 Tax=Allocoleopsis franciscana PCC 7113 TaxID=1173027 RepID=K9WPM9_9CYAN|nr:hypothetical protein [Allocoleopsis franciscana]AFZ21739.1 hypothetical protein Mic7113_6147 [Allocoleopsis franciscana PCC 7113]
MHNKYLAVLSTIILTTGLSLPLTSTHSAPFRLTSMFKTVVGQEAVSSLSPQLEAETAPTDRGAPRDRQGGGTHLS